MTTKNRLEVSWFEKDDGASLVDISCLPALLNSSCLHQLSHLSDLSSKIYTTQICCVRLDKLELPNVHVVFAHALCGHHVNERSDGSVACSFCHCSCDGELVRSFGVKVTLADETRKVSAWCTGQTAAEMLQISPDEFYQLLEEEKAMYLYTLENERFIVAIVNCKSHSESFVTSSPEIDPTWEITRAQKCE